MKFTILASVFAFTAATVAAPGNKACAYKGVLNQWQANDIVHAYQSILQNQTYKGQPPSVTYKKVVAPNYNEYSDSVLSLVSKNNTLGGLAASSREEWYNGVIQHPVKTVQTHNIYVAGGNNILWYWTFSGIGIDRYPVKGFNLLRIDSNLQIYEADIEFNSIAWGVDIFEIQQYCGP